MCCRRPICHLPVAADRDFVRAGDTDSPFKFFRGDRLANYNLVGLRRLGRLAISTILHWIPYQTRTCCAVNQKNNMPFGVLWDYVSVKICDIPPMIRLTADSLIRQFFTRRKFYSSTCNGPRSSFLMDHDRDLVDPVCLVPFHRAARHLTQGHRTGINRLMYD